MSLYELLLYILLYIIYYYYLILYCAYTEYRIHDGTEWCANNEDNDNIRRGCFNDVECLKNGQQYCENDPNCYGVMWYDNLATGGMKLCRSRLLEHKPRDGIHWRTMMKPGMYRTVL